MIGSEIERHLNKGPFFLCIGTLMEQITDISPFRRPAYPVQGFSESASQTHERTAGIGRTKRPKHEPTFCISPEPGKNTCPDK